jgi:hypothetical protein
MRYAMGDDLDRFIPTDFGEFAVFPKQRFREAIFAVENASDVVTFDAQKAFVHIGCLVAGDGDHATVLNADLNMATRPTESAWGFVPGKAITDR